MHANEFGSCGNLNVFRYVQELLDPSDKLWDGDEASCYPHNQERSAESVASSVVNSNDSNLEENIRDESIVQSNKSIEKFEGLWRTTQSDELGINLTFVEGRTASIMMSQGPGTEEVYSIEYMIDGKQLLYNYEGGIQLITFELISDRTMNFINYDGYKIELEKVDFSDEEVMPTPGIYAPLGNRGKTTEDFFTEGGMFLELTSYDNGILQGSFFFISDPPANRIAGVEYLECRIVNGKGEFYYEDDGYGNSGEGMVSIVENTFHFSLTEIERDEFADWNLGTFEVSLYKTAE